MQFCKRDSFVEKRLPVAISKYPDRDMIWRGRACGLIFKFGSKHGNRLSHALEHSVDDLSKNYHGVFTVGEDLVKTLDEAYEIAKKGGNKVVKTVQNNGNVSFVVDLGRKVGYEGGKKGSKKTLNKINIVVEKGTDNVVTAFPTQ